MVTIIFVSTPQTVSYFASKIAVPFFESINLPFKCNQLPWNFTKAMRPLLEFLCSTGYKVLTYLDDFALRPRSIPWKNSSLLDW